MSKDSGISALPDPSWPPSISLSSNFPQTLLPCYTPRRSPPESAAASLSLASLGPGDRRATVFSQDSTGLHHGWGSGEARLVSGGGAANALGRCRPLPARRPIWASTACPCFEFAPVSVCKRAGKGNVLDRTRITFICYQTLLVSGSVLRFVLQLRAYCAIVMLIFNHCCSFDPISLVQTLSSHHDFFGHCERRSCSRHSVPKQG